MTKQEYEAKRTALMDEAKQLLGANKGMEATKKMDAVEALDNEFAAAALEAANKAAMENQKPVRMENLSVDVKGTVTEKMNEYENAVFNNESPEYRTAFFNQLRGKELNDDERRAYASVNGMTNAATASAAIPTQTMNLIVGRLEQVPTIAAIDVTYIPSNVAFPVEDTGNDASWVAMGTAATDSADKIKSVTLAAYKLIKTIEITADVNAMSIDAFEAWLVERLANKIAKAVDAAVYTGTGTNQATGIITTISNATGTFTNRRLNHGKIWCEIFTMGAVQW